MTRFLTRLPWRSLALAAVALVAAAAPGALLLLQYRREAILQGEAWRLLTAHVVHAGTTHLMWDVGALVAIGFLFEQVLRHRFWIVLWVSSMVVGGGLLVFEPQLTAYCGLSGVLNGLWVAGAILSARAEDRAGRVWVARLCRAGLLALVAKIAFETATGSSLFNDETSLAAIPVPRAHLLGALGGVVAVYGQALIVRAARTALPVLSYCGLQGAGRVRSGCGR